MYHSKLLLLLFSLLITIFSKLANPAMTKFFEANAELGTIWKNNPSILHNGFPDDKFSVRLIFPRPYGMARISVDSYVDSVPLFACGFFCAGLAATCDTYIFSIFIVNAFSVGPVLYLESPQVVWSANHDWPVRENATVQLTELGDLVLYDADGTLVWFTNTTGKSVVGMNLTGSGNLVLLDHKNMEVWRSFDHPTDTLVTGQMLHFGQKLIASTSATNWAKGKFYLTLLSNGIYVFAGVDTLAYYQSSTGGNIIANTSAYIALKNGNLEVFTLFSGTEGPDYPIQLPMNAYGLEFVRLDWDGHLRLYQGGNGSWVSSDLLDITDPCSYPLVCGEYGICSNGQCSYPDSALRQFGLFELIDPRQLNHGCFLTDSLSCGSA